MRSLPRSGCEYSWWRTCCMTWESTTRDWWTVAAIDYTAIFWGVLFGYAIWGERPGANLVLGAAVVIASGLYIVRRRQPAPAA